MAATLVCAGPAAADPVVGGRTFLDAAGGALTNLAVDGVSASAGGAARLTNRGVRFPISGGDLSEGPVGTVLHSGSLVLARDGRRVRLARPVLTIGAEAAAVSGTVAGTHMPLFSGDMSDAGPLENPDNPYGVKRIRFRLTREGAAAINAALGASFGAGDPVGRLNVRPFVNSDPQEAA